MASVITALRNDQSELGQQTTNLVDLRGALFGQPTADAVQAQHGLLIFGLDRDKAHVGPTDGFADGLGIVVVILAALAIRSDKAGRNDPGIVAEFGQLPGPVVRAGTGFHADQGRWQLCEERQQFSPDFS